MHDTLLIIQYFSIAGVFIESLIVVRKWKTPVHMYLLLSCVACLINNLGYLLEMTSKTKEAYITALRFSYLGRVWFSFFMLLFVAEQVRIRIPTCVKYGLILIHVLVYVVILTPNNLYYTKTMFATGGIFPKLTHGNGIVYYAFMILQSVYILLGLIWLFIRLHREKSKIGKKCLITVIIAIFSETMFYFFQIFWIEKITYEYDLTMLGFFIGTLFMLIAILRYNLLGMDEIARDFVVDRMYSISTNRQRKYSLIFRTDRRRRCKRFTR